MTRYLLDTNVLSEITKHIPNPNVVQKMKDHRHEIVTAAPVWHELQFGCMRLPVSKRRSMIQDFLLNLLKSDFQILPYDVAASDWHAEQRALLTNAGRPPAFIDGQIAAITRVNNLILVTRNTSDFVVFPELDIENWHL